MNKLSDYTDYVEEKIANVLLTNKTYVGVDNLLPNRGGVKTSSYKPDEGASIKFKKNDILIGNIRPYFKKIWLATFDGGCSSDVLCIRPKKQEYSKYLYCVLSQDSFFDYDMAGSKGSKMPRGDKNHIMNFPVEIINDYKKIGNILFDIDAQIKRNNDMVQKLQVLTHNTFDYFSKHYNNNKITLNDIIIENNKSRIQVNNVINGFGDIPFFTSGESILYTNQSLANGFNIFLSTGGNAKVQSYYGDVSYSTDTWCITSKNNLQYYLYEYLKHIESQMDRLYFHGTGLKHLQKPLFLKSVIDVPSDNIVQKFNSIVEPIYIQTSKMLQSNLKLQKLKEKLLPLLINQQLS